MGRGWRELCGLPADAQCDHVVANNGKAAGSAWSHAGTRHTAHAGEAERAGAQQHARVYRQAKTGIQRLEGAERDG